MDSLTYIFQFLIWLVLFASSVVISCAVGFSLFPASARIRQLGSSLILLVILQLVSFELIIWEWPRGYSVLVLIACVVLALRLFDTTDSMIFNGIRSGLILLIALLVLLHMGFLIFLLGIWLMNP